jgi:transcriptional regulator with XRE-family HTH domain
MAPRIDHRKDYESPLNDYRIAAGLTHKELAAKANVQCTMISALANGTFSPIKENGSGQLRKDAKKLCEFFKVGPEDLFPRYVCSLNRSHKFDMQPYETWSERAADNCGAQLENSDLAWVLIKKGMANATSMEIRVFIDYIFNNETFADIARKECVSTTRVIDNFKKSLRRIVGAAQKLGFAIDAERCRMTVKQRFLQ